ncbi:hypothetical protein HY988_05055 [Candidatus Micrarchaeota archaeon]|nr:hypothetical protein [Candidatus Micrarchaeota archaeon]
MRFRLTQVNWSKLVDRIIWQVIPALVALLCFRGFSNFILLYQSPGKATQEAVNFIWNTILFTFVVGALILGMKLNRKKSNHKLIERTGFLIILSGLLMIIGLAFQGFYISNQDIRLLSQIGEAVATIGELALFIGIVFFTFGLAKDMISQTQK